MKSWPCVLLLTGVALTVASASFAVTIHVPAEQPTIAAGIEAAVNGDTVLVACGAYEEHAVTIDKAICIRSETGEPGCVTIDALGHHRIFTFQDVGDGTRLEGFTLTGGLVPESDPWRRGGAIACFDASPQISDCVLIANEAEMGGSGLYCHNASPTVTRCEFLYNLGAVDGGGIYINGDAAPVISHCTLVGNDALFWGGGIFCHLASATISHCTLVGNSAHWGGGFWCVGAHHVLIENTIIGFSEEGEGVYVYDNASHPSDVAVVCSDVFGNSGGNYGGAIEDQTGINGNISEHPIFCDLEGGDLRLASTSPCLPEHNGCNVQMGARGMGCDYPTALAAGAPARRFTTWNAPNPFNPTTVIHFELPEAGPVSVRIYDTDGRLVRELLRLAPHAAGTQRVRWDGRDADGVTQGSGIYFYRLDTASGSATRKMTLIR